MSGIKRPSVIAEPYLMLAQMYCEAIPERTVLDRALNLQQQVPFAGLGLNTTDASQVIPIGVNLRPVRVQFPARN